MNVLVVAAMLKEYHCAREVLSAVEEAGVETIRFSRKSIKKNNLFILQCGYNSRQAMEEIVQREGPMDLIIDSGSCGLLKGDSALGDFVKTQWVSDSQESKYPIPSCSWDAYFTSIHKVSCLQVSSPVQSQEEKENFQTRGDICTMETMDVFRFSRECKSEFLSLRVITDKADKNSMADFKENLRPYCLTLYDYLKDFLLFISH